MTFLCSCVVGFFSHFWWICHFWVTISGLVIIHVAHISVWSSLHSFSYLSTSHGLVGAVGPCRSCLLWRSSAPAFPTVLGAPWGAQSLSCLPALHPVGGSWAEFEALQWTAFCSTFSGLATDLWDHCQPFLLSCSFNTACPELQLFLMLWVNS